MQKNILDALERLTTPGNQTSEGKTTRSLTWSFILVIIAALASAWCGINSTGSVAIVISGILALLFNSATYVNARTNVKEAISGLLNQPAVQVIIKEMGIPSALPLKLGAFPAESVPVKPRAARTMPTDIGPPAAPPDHLTLKDAINGPVQPHRYTIRLRLANGSFEDIPFDGTRFAACQEADRLRTLPENQGTKIHVL